MMSAHWVAITAHDVMVVPLRITQAIAIASMGPGFARLVPVWASPSVKYLLMMSAHFWIKI